ncbi:MAG: chorismate synthase [Planctomycetota bacterium]|nr:chorismate synthase [Planctomycetota bacterium]
MRGLRWTTAGESHGQGLVGVLEGMPAGLELSLERIDAELARRQGGYGRSPRQLIEKDRIELLSGTRHGRTLGSPLAFRLKNKDHSIEKLDVPTTPRPGHADLAGCQRLGSRDIRAVLERASARETAARVALGSMARQLLEAFDIEVFAHVVALGGEEACPTALDAAFDAAGDERRAIRAASAFHCLDPDAERRFRERVDRAAEEEDSLGGVFEVRALSLPPGLGTYTDPRERLTARLGGALFSIPAMKGVEFGLGFAAAARPGSEVHDAIELAPPATGPGAAQGARGTGGFGRFRRASNRAGGLEGGMTTGEPLVVRVAMKPIPTLRRGMPTVDLETGEPVQAVYLRSDVTAVPAASVVGEAVLALELAGAFLETFGGPSMDAVRAAWEAWRVRVQEV